MCRGRRCQDKVSEAAPLRVRLVERWVCLRAMWRAVHEGTPETIELNPMRPHELLPRMRRVVVGVRLVAVHGSTARPGDTMTAPVR